MRTPVLVLPLLFVNVSLPAEAQELVRPGIRRGISSPVEAKLVSPQTGPPPVRALVFERRSDTLLFAL